MVECNGASLVFKIEKPGGNTGENAREGGAEVTMKTNETKKRNGIHRGVLTKFPHQEVRKSL